MVLSPLIPFLIPAMFSPGPNVIMLTTSGAKFGLRATWPHLLGVIAGVGGIGAISGFGIGALLAAQPALRLVLQIIAFVWILWMAYALWTRGTLTGSADRPRPMRFYEAAVFQAVNPKIWAIALAASSGFGSDLPLGQEAARMAGSFMAVNFCVCTFWTSFGQVLSRLLHDPVAWTRFNRIMAGLLAASGLMVFL